MLLNEGELDDVRVLKPESVRLARSNLMPKGPVFNLLGGKVNGFGCFMQVVLPGGEFPGASRPVVRAGAARRAPPCGSTRSTRSAVALMVQFFPALDLTYLDARAGRLQRPQGDGRAEGG